MELKDTINTYNNLSTPSLDHVSLSYLKDIIKDNQYYSNIVNIVNTCINLIHWLMHFKKSLSIIIPKPNKPLYNILKVFYSIMFLNILGKLIEKAISKRLQVHTITSNFVHSSQLGGIKQ